MTTLHYSTVQYSTVHYVHAFFLLSCNDSCGGRAAQRGTAKRTRNRGFSNARTASLDAHFGSQVCGRGPCSVTSMLFLLFQCFFNGFQCFLNAFQCFFECTHCFVRRTFSVTGVWSRPLLCDLKPALRLGALIPALRP